MAQRRIVMIAGSGETSPRMAPVHRAVVRRLEADLGRRAAGVVLDTTYGFQENADHITERAVRYFRDRVGIHVEPVRLRRSGVAADDAAATEAIHSADFVFAGPGSPSYALHHWRASGVAWALREKLDTGGALSFASAAAITLGAFAIPVYEVYKAGHDVHWLAGLDILSAAGLRVAVVPHFNNSEGGAHDSRYAYIGERRFLELESQLPDEAWVLGIDEDTALTIDIDEQIAEVRGRGAVTVRAGGTARQLRSGSPVPLSQLHPTAGRRRSTRAAARASRVRADSASRNDAAGARRESIARAALDAGDVNAAVEAMLELEQDALGPSRAPEEAARHALRAAILRIGELAAAGRTEKARSEMLIGALLTLRSRARDAGDWRMADEIRDALGAAGVSIRDTASGSVWEPSGPVDRGDSSGS